MKKINLNDLNIKQLSHSETEKVNGGKILGAITVIGAAIYVYNNWDDVKRGLNDGWNKVYNY
jgi:hypothetical protein